MLHMAGEHLSATFPTGLGGISRPIKFDAQAKALGPGIRRTKTHPTRAPSQRYAPAPPLSRKASLENPGEGIKSVVPIPRDWVRAFIRVAAVCRPKPAPTRNAGQHFCRALETE